VREPSKLDRRLNELAAKLGPDPDRLGSVASIDPAAIARATAAVRQGRSVSLARPLVDGDPDDDKAAHLEPWVEEFGRVTVGYDRFSAACHGLDKTHLDGLSHVGWEGAWYGGVPTSQIPRPTSIETWARTGIVTRGLYVDIPSFRGSSVVGAEDPATAAEIEGVLSRAGLRPEPGDALILDLGRDRLTSDGPNDLYQAVTDDVAEWLADHSIAVLLWDLLDAPIEPRERLNVHRLIWAIGLAMVDNCNFAAARAAGAGAVFSEGMTVVAPLPIVGATGSLVNPLLVF
jgi:hypothetical protein